MVLEELNLIRALSIHNIGVSLVELINSRPEHLDIVVNLLMDVVRGWNGVSHRFNLILDKILCGEGINGLKDGVTSLIDGGVGPGLGQTLEEVADVGLHGLPVGGAVNPILDGLMDSGHLVKNCLDVVLQSREIFYNQNLSSLYDSKL